MKREEVQSIFTLAGFQILAMKELIDGYCYKSDDPRFYETLPRLVWWFVKTEIGWIEIGWRKRVINIDWSDTAVRKIVTVDDVTKGEYAYPFYSLAHYLLCCTGCASMKSET